MRKFLRTLLGAAAIALAPLPAQALTTIGPDMSDLWYIPDESGWGVNLVHQYDIVFMTLFVYGADGRARWYVADSLQYTDFGSTAFSGKLYETTGPHFSGPFNPDLVGVREVGAVSIGSTAADTARLTYSIDGIQVTKNIQRQTFRANNLAGSYIGGISGFTSGCGAGMGPFSGAATFEVSHVGAAVEIAATASSGLDCTYSGAYEQSGRMGGITGQLSCSNGSTATFRAYELEAGTNGFLTRYTAEHGGGCTEYGRIGGLRR